MNIFDGTTLTSKPFICRSVTQLHNLYNQGHCSMDVKARDIVHVVDLKIVSADNFFFDSGFIVKLVDISQKQLL